MPRGNLETICPRAYVLAMTRILIRRLSYYKAFVLMRKHRVNLNLIYDLAPTTLEANM